MGRSVDVATENSKLKTENQQTMKRTLITSLFTLLTALITNFFAQRVMAQSSPGVLTADQATAVKAIRIANLDKDTYFKSGGFILERYEDRPAYVFTYSDGITRKVYLYKVYSAADTKELGLLALYQNGKTNEVKSFVIPGSGADRKAWDAYIDDLKYVGEKEPGLMSTLTFVLSREMSALMGGGGSAKADDGVKKKEEYNFCFGPNARVTLPNGDTKAISQVRAGDEVLGYDAASNTLVSSRVTAVDAHAGTFRLVGVWLVPTQELTASRATYPAQPVLLEATATHPVLTATGRKSLGDVTTGDTLYRYENNQLVPYQVVRVGTTGQAVERLYNLRTQPGGYVVDGTVVLDK